jgi:hypothetical protein
MLISVDDRFWRGVKDDVILDQRGRAAGDRIFYWYDGLGLAIYVQYRSALLLRNQRKTRAMPAQHRGATESVVVPLSGLPFRTQITSDDVIKHCCDWSLRQYGTIWRVMAR